MTSVPPRPIDATLTVTSAARFLGVHPNTVRTWSDAGRLRYYRINRRGDRRYRRGDLERFLSAASARAPLAPRMEPHRAPARDNGPSAEPAGNPQHAPAFAGVEVVADLAAVATRAVGRDALPLDELLARATRIVADGFGLALSVVWQIEGTGLVPLASAGPAGPLHHRRAVDAGTVGRALADRRSHRPVLDPAPSDPVAAGLGPELAVAVEVGGAPWGALLLGGLSAFGAEPVATAVARSVAALVELAASGRRLTRTIDRGEAMRRVAADLGSRLDLGEIAAASVDHARELFGADRAALHLRRPDGSAAAAAGRGLTAAWLGHPGQFGPGSLPTRAIADRRAAFAIVNRDVVGADPMAAAAVDEGFETICVAPLFVAGEVIGVLSVMHDRPHPWSSDELDTIASFATQASVAIRTARNYSQMATWAAQLQSIQQLGARLNRLTSVREIGLAIATELRQLIDYHNVRVYRQEGSDLIPVAISGQVGEYVDETPDQLRVALGQGITGWVALNKLPQSLPDAASDPRTNTIAGTQDDLDESMLLAPMVFEDDVLGVLVLSKLGLRQFSDDDLRLLVIYASFAAQAMANADATERLRRQSEALERQVRSQREMLQITESILTTLDPRAVLDQIADRLGELVGYDNISIEVFDRAARMLRPLTARGVNAADYLEEWEVGETGIATWVIENNEAVLILDQFEDPRVRPFESTGPVHGGLIVVPLRGREGVTGVLTMERLGLGNTFSVDEFELVKLFAAQVSIALQNAEVHSAVAIRARSDDLTGLLNHGTFVEWLGGSVARDERFSLIMIDLDTFKAVNDALGHQAGDRLLAQIGRAIVGAGRDTDHVFRYGGDEFTMLLPGADPGAAAAVAERVRGAVHAVGGPGTPWEHGGLRVSASFGIASFPADGSTAESVLLAADRACFVAKRQGQGLIATAEEGLALAAEFSLQEPTPVDPPTVAAA